jgi:hypothetical protein
VSDGSPPGSADRAMTAEDKGGAAANERRLRRGLFVLAVAGTVGVGLELGLLRHWAGPLQLVAWSGVAVLGAALLGLRLRASRRAVLAVRALAAVALAIGMIGVVVHVHENYEAAPLDYRYAATWETTPEWQRWIMAGTDTVGPAPSLAPAALSFVALTLLLGTVGNPALRDDATA